MYTAPSSKSTFSSLEAPTAKSWIPSPSKSPRESKLVPKRSPASRPEGNKAVQEVIAAKQYYNCHKAIVITNNTFTKSAKDLARKCRVELFDYEVLKKLV
mgnify:CR=1 FL=1